MKYGKLFTGQVIVDVINNEEYVLCAKCMDASDTIGFRSTAWYDPYSKKYVHSKCLSEKRRAEILADGGRFL